MVLRFVSTIFIVIIGFLLISCKKNNICLQSDESNNSYGLVNNTLFIEIDSTINSFKGCEYLVSFPFYIEYVKKTIAAEGIIRFTSNCAYLTIMEPHSKEFVLFDYGVNIDNVNNIIIDFDNCESDTFHYSLIHYVQVEKEVYYLFRLDDIYYLDEPYWRFLDVVLIVSKNKGIIGSFFTDFENDEKLMFYPSGNLIDEFVDYSGYKRVKIE